MPIRKEGNGVYSPFNTMIETITIPSKIGEISVYVIIEDFDMTTGHVTEKYVGNPHVFHDTFHCRNWEYLLSLIGIDTFEFEATRFIGLPAIFFITNSDEAIEDDFPYLKGEIELWGTIGMRSDDARRGEYIANQSFIGVDASIPPDLITGEASRFPKGKGMAWRYVYEFYDNTLSGKDVCCVGITSQYGTRSRNTSGIIWLPIDPRFNDTIPVSRVDWSLSPHKEIRLTRANFNFNRLFVQRMGGVLRDNKIFCMNVRRIGTESKIFVDKVNVLENRVDEIDVTSVFIRKGTQFSVGVSFDSKKMYLASQENNVLDIYEMEDDSFETLLSVSSRTSYSGTELAAAAFTYTSGASVHTGCGFAVFNNKMYVFNYLGLYYLDLGLDEPWTLASPALTNVFTFNIGAFYTQGFITIERGYLFMLGGNSTGTLNRTIVRGLEYSMPVFNVTTGEFVARMTLPNIQLNFTTFLNPNTSTLVFSDPATTNLRFLSMTPNTNKCETLAAFSAAIVPEHMRIVQRGMGKRFTYHLQVMHGNQ